METLQIKQFASYLKPRPRDWHKGLSGHLLIIGGNVGMAGAVRMAAAAALRVGAGLVTVITQPSHAQLLNASGVAEVMYHAAKDEKGLEPLLAKANAIVLGPGLGQCEWAKSLWLKITESELPLVVDADGLNLLAAMPMSKSNWILTPHPAEAGRLLQIKTANVMSDREDAVTELCDRFGGVAVLKGAGTLIKTQKDEIAICKKGNPGMATAGMGDVLSGVIGGLLAQGIPLVIAAKLGVLIHALAGDLAAKEGERGMVASDVIFYLRRLVNPK